MKVLHIIPSYEPAWHLGGVITAISQLCKGLAKQGMDVTVFTTDSGQDRRMRVPLNEMVELSGVKVMYFKTDFNMKYAYSQALRNACHRLIRDFDIVHITSFWCYPGIPAISEALRRGIPYLLSVHGTLRRVDLSLKSVKRLLYFLGIEKRNIERAAALHYTTDMERKLDASYRFTVPSFIVPNGVNQYDFKEIIRTNEAKKFWGLNPDAPVITFLGRLAPVKALDTLVKAVSLSNLKKRGLQVLLAGPDGGSEVSLKHLVKEVGLDSHVHFLGPIDPMDRNKLFAASDLLTLVSTGENFGYVAVEAMLAGVPVLLSEHVGICHEVQVDGAGMVVPLKEEAIAQALTQMLSNPEKLKAMGRSAASAARRRYDIDLVAKRMTTAYEDILTGRRSPLLSWSNLK